MRGLFVLAVIVALLGIVGCGPRDTGGTEEETVDIRGTIVDLSPAEEGGEAHGFFLVEGQIEEDTEYDRAAVTVTAETRIFTEESGERREATFDDLHVGQRVEVTFTGPVAESYPVQATAGRILILAGAQGTGGAVSPLPKPQESPLSPLPSPEADPVAAAVDHLATELGISPAEIDVLSVEAVDWSDTSLGCPQPGMMYAQVITPGYRVILEARGERHEVHTDRTGRSVVVCRPSLQGLRGPEDAFSILLTHLMQAYPGFGLDQREGWASEDRTPSGLVGASTWAWRSGEWTLEIAYPVVPHPTYQGTLVHDRAGVIWRGVVGADGEVTPAEDPPVLGVEPGPCEGTVSPEAAGVEVSVQGGAIHIDQNVYYTCCAELALAAGRDGSTIKVIETNVGQVCRCMCNYRVIANLEGLSSGVYVVEVWGVQYFDAHPLELLGRAEVTVP